MSKKKSKEKVVEFSKLPFVSACRSVDTRVHTAATLFVNLENSTTFSLLFFLLINR